MIFSLMKLVYKSARIKFSKHWLWERQCSPLQVDKLLVWWLISWNSCSRFKSSYRLFEYHIGIVWMNHHLWPQCLLYFRWFRIKGPVFINLQAWSLLSMVLVKLSWNLWDSRILCFEDRIAQSTLLQFVYFPCAVEDRLNWRENRVSFLHQIWLVVAVEMLLTPCPI